MKKGILTSLILKRESISRLICLLLTVVIFSTGINVPALAGNPATQTDLGAVEEPEVTEENTDDSGDAEDHPGDAEDHPADMEEKLLDAGENPDAAEDDPGNTEEDPTELSPEADPAPETANQDSAAPEKEMKEPEKEGTEEAVQPEAELRSENIEPGNTQGNQETTEPNPEETADNEIQEKIPVDCTAVINDVINGTLQSASQPYRIRLSIENTDAVPILISADADFAVTLRITGEENGHTYTYNGTETNPETGRYETGEIQFYKLESSHLLEIESADGKTTDSFQISILRPQKENNDIDDQDDDTDQTDEPGTEPEENQEESEQTDDLKTEIHDAKSIKQVDNQKSLSLLQENLKQTEVNTEPDDGSIFSDVPRTRGETFTVSIPTSKYYTLTCLKQVSNSNPIQISDGETVSAGDVLQVTIRLNDQFSTDDGYLLESIKVDHSDPEGTEFFTDFTDNFGVYTCEITVSNSNIKISGVIKVQKTYTITVNWKNGSYQISNDNSFTAMGVQTRKSSSDSWTDLEDSENIDYFDEEWTYTHKYDPDNPSDVRFVEIDSSGSKIDPDSQTKIGIFNVEVEDDEGTALNRAFYEVSYTTDNESLNTVITNTLSTSERTLKVNFTDEGNKEERPEKIKAVLQYKKSNGQWITIKQQDVSNSNNWKATFSGVPKLASTSSNDPIRIRLVNDAGGLVYDHIGTPDADDPNPDDNDREAFFNSVQGVPGIELPAEECSVTYHDVDYVRTNSGAGIPSYYPGRMRASGNALRDGGGGGAGNEEQVNLGDQLVTLKFRVRIDWRNDVNGMLAPVRVQLQQQDQPNGAWSEIDSHAFKEEANWNHRFEILGNQIANDYRVRELDRNGKVLEQDESGIFDIYEIGRITQASYLASYQVIPNPNNGEKRFVIVNKLSNKNCSARIVWDGNGQQFESMNPVDVVLQKKGNNDQWSDVATIELSNDNHWEAGFNAQLENGVQYRVLEKENTGNNIIENNGVAVMKVFQNGQQKDVAFTVGYAADANGLTTITNTRKEEQKYTAKIVWADEGQQFEGKDPIEVVLQKQVNGQWADVETKTLSSNNNWQTQFDTSIMYGVQTRIREKENTGDRKIVEFDGSPAKMSVTQNGKKKTVNYNVKYAAQEDGMATITNILGDEGQREHYVALFWRQFPEEAIPESVKVVLQRKNKEDGDWKTIQTMLLKKADNWEGVFKYQQEAEDEKLRVRELNADDEVVLDADRDDHDGYGVVPMWYRITDANNNQCCIYMKIVTCFDDDKQDPNYPQYDHITNINNSIPVEKYTVTVDWDDESRQAGLEGSVKIREQVKKSEEEAWEDLETDLDELFSNANNWTNTYEHDYLSVAYFEEIDEFEVPVTKRMKFRYRLVDSDGNTVDENGLLTANDANMEGNIAWKVTYETNAYNYIIHLSRIGLTHSAKKVWQNDNIAAYIPDSVTARLQGCKNPNGDGAWETIQDITLNRDNNWEAKFNPVDINTDYKKFRVREIDGQNKIILIDTDSDYADADANKATFATGEQGNVTYQKVSYNEYDTGLTTITNEQPAGGIKYHAKIHWNDDDNQFTSKEPITAVLQRKGNNNWVDQKTVILNSANNWEADFEAVQRNQGDQYRIREKENAGDNLIIEENVPARLKMTREGENEAKNVLYKARYDENDTTTTINNTYLGDNEVNVSLYWNDKRNDQNIRPESVTVKLKRNNVATDQTQELKKNNGWHITFENLPLRDDQNRLIQYSIDVEKTDVVTGEDGKDTYSYEIKDNGDGYFDLNLKHTPKATVSGRVTWEETGAATEAERPGSVEIKLTAPGQDSQTTTARAVDNWNYQFDNLTKYTDSNIQITYSVSGAKADGYTTTQQGYNFHNKKHRDKEDNEEQQEHQPENENMDFPGGNIPNVPGGGAAVAGIWKKIAIGVGIAAGIGAITGIIKGITDTGDNNTPSTARITVSGQVKWKNVSRDEDYPDHVTIRLLADGVPTDDLAYIDKQNRGPDDWTFRFDNLYKVDQETGKKIQYTVREDPVDNFETEITTSDGKIIVTNTYQKNYTSLPVGVIWDDLNNNDGCRPESVTVTVSDKSVELNEKNKWNAIINRLPVGETLTPEISRTTVITGTDGSGTYKISRPERNEGKEDIKAGEFFILTHTPETIPISGTVAWDDDNNRDSLRPEQVELQLICKHPDKDETIDLGSQYRAVVTKEDNWEFSFDSAPKYYAGKEIVYSVEEDEIENYTPSYATENNGGVTITVTNSHTPETITIAGTITWVDDNNPNRPANVTINLLANDQETDQSVTVTADQDGRWQFSFTGFPKNENGQAIKYSITERPVENYCIAIQGFDVTNTIENYEIRLDPGVEGSDEFTDPDTAGTEPDTTKVYMSPDQPSAFRYAPELCLDMSLMDRATRDGYVLNSWYNRNNMKWTDRTTVRHEYCDPDAESESGHAHKITLTAGWKPRNAAVRYELPEGTEWKDGEEPASENVALNGTVQLRAEEDAIQLGESKVFKGWQDQAGYLYQPGDSFQYTSIDQVSKFGMNTPADNPNIIILTAKIEEDPSSQQTEEQWTLIFDSQGGTVIEPMTVTADAPVTEAEMKSWIESKTGKTQPVRTSYLFAGWHTEKTGYAPVEYPITVASGEKSKTIYAHWTPVNYKLTFNTDGGPDVEKGNKQWLAYLTPLTNSDRPAENVDAPYVIDETKKDNTGHEYFTGWNPSLPDAMPAYDLTVKAMWEPTIYRIYLNRRNDDGQTVRKTITGPYGSTVTAPNDPVRTDAVFIGWKKQKKSANEADVWGLPDTMGDDNPTYVAQWRETPDAPEAEAGDTRSILVTAEEGQEYRIRVKDGEWREWVQPDENGEFVFTDLTTGTTYEISTRYAAVAADAENGIPEFPASKASLPTAVTLKEEQDAPVPPMLQSDIHSVEVIAPKTGQVYRININDEEWTDWAEPDQDGKVVFTGLEEDTLFTVQTKLKSTRKKYESALSSASIYTRKLTIEEIIIDGSALFGQTLSARFEPAEAQGVTWQWYRDGEPVSGETGTQYTVTEQDREHLIGVKATQHVNSTDEDNIIVQTAGRVPKAGEIQIVLENMDGLLIQLTEPEDGTILDIAELTHEGAKKAQLEGAEIKIRVVMNDLNEADVSADERQALQNVLKAEVANAKVLSYIGVTVWLIIDGNETEKEQITELGNHSLTFILTVPEEDRKPERIYFTANSNGDVLSGEGYSYTLGLVIGAVYALGVSDPVTIYFDTDGGSEIDPVTQKCGMPLTPPEDPIKKGYVFVCWTFNGEDVDSLPSIMPEEDRTYKAKWLKKHQTPAAPTVVGKTPETITVEAKPGQEYSIDGGESWQTEDTFNGLTPNTVYSIVTRMAATADAAASEMSKETKATTPKYEQEAPDAPGVKATQTTIEVTTAREGQQYAIDGTDNWVNPDEEGRVVFTGLLPGTTHKIYARWAETKTQYASPASEPANITTGTTRVYIVYQDAKGEWPAEAPAVPSEEAAGIYVVPGKADATMIPEGTDPEGFIVTGHSAEYPTENRTAVLPGTRIILQEEQEELYIYYARNEYPLTFYEDIAGTRVLQTYEVRYGATLADDPEIAGKTINKEGFAFVGWSESVKTEGNYSYRVTVTGSSENESAGLVKLSEMTMPAAAKSLNPVMFRYPVKVILDAEDAELDEGQPKEILLDCGETLDMTLMNRAWKAGYGLAGWYTKNGTKWDETMGVDPATCDIDETGNPLLTEEAGKRYFYYTMTLVPRWALRWTNVLYDLDGGSGEIENSLVLPGGLVSITENVPTPSAEMEFAGWTDQNGNLYQAKQKFEYKNLDTVTEAGEGFYDWTGAAQGEPPAGEHNTIKLTAVYRPLSEDVGWLVFTNAENVKDASVVRPVEVTIPAGADYTEVRITIAEDGKSFIVTQGEKTVGTRTVPTRTGYRFTGWSLTENGTAIGENAAVIIQRNQDGKSSTTVYSMWTEQEYSITFRTNGGTEIPVAKYAYKAAIKEENHQTSKLHNDFAGWRYLGEGENIQPHSLPAKMPAEDLTVEAIWTPVLYKMIFIDGEDELGRIEAAFGTAISEPENPIKEGYIFIGWTFNGEDVDSLPSTMPGEDRTYQAKWLRKQTPPPAPTVTGKTPVTITVETKPGQEYSIDEGESWQTEDTFTGLTPNTVYSIVTRMAATADAAASEMSKETKATTPKYEQEAPDAPGVKATQTTIEVTTVTEGQQYAIDGTDDWVNPDEEGRVVFSGLLPGTIHKIYARWAETNTQYASPASNPANVTTETTKVYVVYQNEKGEWPAEAPTVPSEEAAGFYIVPEKADATMIPEGTDSEGFTVTGYSAEYPTENRTAVLPGTRIILEEEQENLYIYYARNKYPLTFYEDIAGTRVLQTYEVRYGATLADNPEIAGKTVNKEGFAFAGWSESVKTEGDYSYRVTKTNSGENAVLLDLTEMTMPAAAKSLYPVMFRYPVKVILDAEDVELDEGQPKEILLDCGETLDMTLMNRAWKAGYGLAGWYTKNGTKWDENIQFDPAACDMDEAGAPLLTEEEGKRYFYYKMTLVPRWTLRWTNVLYDLDGGSGEMENSLVLPGGLVSITGNVPTPPAEKEFAGWTDQNGNLYQANQQFEYKNLDAVTKLGTEFYKYDTLQGEPPKGKHNTIKLTAVYRPLSEDVGWLVFTNAENVKDASIVRPVEVTIPAGAESTEVRITVAEDGESFIVTQGEKTVGTRTVPTRTGYRFTGWSLTKDSNVAIGPDDTVKIQRNQGGKSSTTVYSLWTEQEYTITFRTNGGTEILKATYAYQEKINEANHQTSKLHNTFAGWRYLGEGENIQPHSLPSKMPAEDLTVEAIWTPVLYKMIFIDGEDELGRIEAAFGTAISEPEDPIKEGYIFIGWTFNGEDVDSLPSTMPGEDRTYLAKWLRKQTPPPAPTVIGKTPVTITVETKPGQEYSIDDGESWQTADTFTGLTPNTAYSIVTRMAATADAAASEMSKATEATTPKYEQKAPDAPGVKATQTTIEVTTVTEGQQYAIDGTDDWVNPDEAGRVVFSGLLPGTTHKIYARWAETNTQDASPASNPANVTTETTKVYVVYQNEKGEWPAEAPTVPSEEAAGFYIVPEKADATMIPEGTEPEGFTVTGYSAEYPTENRTAVLPGTRIILQEEQESLYIYFARNKYPLTFYEDIAGTRVLQTYEVWYGATLADNPEIAGKTVHKEGFAFAGWSESARAEGNYSYRVTVTGSSENKSAGLVNLSEMTMPAEAKNLYPVLFRYPVKVILDAEDVELEEDQPRRILLDCGETFDMTLMNRAWKAGYGLAGWYTKNGTKWDENMQVDPAACDMDEAGNPLLTEEAGKRYFYYKMTLVPRWAIRWTNVVYDLNGGSAEVTPEDLLVLPGGGVSITENVPTPPAEKEFAGWTDQNGNLYQAKQRFNYKNLDAVTETGKEFYDWTGGEPGGPPAGEHNTIKLTAVYRPLSAEVGWLVFTNAETVKDASVVRPVEVTIPAGAESTEVRITVAEDGKSFIVTQEGESVGTRTVPTWNGYRFTGWSLTENGAAIGEDAAVIIQRNQDGKSSTTVYSMWTEQEYSITFRTNGGTEIPTAKYAYKAAIKEENHQTSKLHNDFAGWRYLGEGENIQPHSLPANMPAEDLTVEAIWTPVLYKMIFKDGEDELGRIEAAFGTAISEPENPIKEGYIFIGWTFNGEDVDSLPSTMPGEDRTYQAKWIRKQMPPVAPTVTGKTPVTITVETKPGQEYSIDGGESWQTEDTFTGLTPNTQYSIVTRMAATADAAASEMSIETKAKTPKYEQEAPDAPGVKVTQTTIAVTTVTEGQQYAIDGTDDWVNPDDEGRMVFTGLLPGTTHKIYARWAETKTQYTSPASEPANVTTETTKVYVVYQNEKGEWPAEAPTESSDEAEGFYIVPEKADATMIPEGTEPEGFTVTGYSADYPTENRKAVMPGTRIILQEEQENLYIYYERNKYPLTFYEDIAGTKVLQTYEVRYGAALTDNPEIAAKIVDQEGFAFVGWSESARAEGNYSYRVTETGSSENESAGLVKLSEMTMPAAAKSLYPVMFRYPVKVILDAEDVELEEDQPRRILLDCGETLDMTLMNRAWKAGYGLAGWYTKNGTKWDENMQVDPAACDMDEAGNPLLTEEAGRRYFYYKMTLAPRWAIRWTNVVYDLNGGSAEVTPEDLLVLPGGGVSITENVPTPPAEMEFAGWTDRNGNLYQAKQRFNYKNLDAVTETGEEYYDWTGGEPGGPPAGEHNTIKLTAVYRPLSTDVGWLVFTNAETVEDASVVRPVEVTIPAAGNTEVGISIAEGGKSFIVTQEGETVGTRSVPTRTGYCFTGWSLTKDGSVAIGPDDTVKIQRNTQGGTSSTTVYSMWEKQKYTITFRTNGGTEIPKATYAYQEKINEANHQTSKHHNTFAGWRYLGEGENVQPHSLPSKMPAEDLIVEAIWTPVLYKMTFNDGENELGRIEAAFGTAISKPKDPEPENNKYIFAGWTLNGNDIVSLPTTMPGEDRTYQAKWLGKQDPPSEPIIVINVTPTTITVETEGRDGQEYSIDGGKSWQKEDTFTGLTPDTTYSIVARMAATADAVASEMSEETEATTTKYPQKAPDAPGVKATQTTIEVTTVTEGQQYAIDGTEDWVDPNDEGRVVFTGLLPGSEHRVYARWTSTKTQDASPASEPADITTNGEIIQELDNQNGPEIFDYIELQPEEIYAIAGKHGLNAKARQMAGETITMKIVVSHIENKIAEEEKKLIQETLKNVHALDLLYLDISVELMIGNDQPVRITNFGDYALTLKMRVPDQYKAVGNVDRIFYIASVHEGNEKILKSSRELIFDFDAALFSTYALGASDQATITFDTDGGSEIAPITLACGTDVIPPENPTKEGNTFAGWDPAIPETMPAKNLTVKAQWKINQYTITFDKDGGSKTDPITQDYGTAITKPANPTKEGYTFIGWDPAIPETMPAKDLTVKAKWKINRYTITFDTDGGNKIASITLDYGATITKPASPTKSGYTFTGWSPAIPDKMPAGNMTVKAQWKLNDTKSVNTGDDSNMALWIALLVLLVAGLAGFNIWQMKKRRKNH